MKHYELQLNTTAIALGTLGLVIVFNFVLIIYYLLSTVLCLHTCRAAACKNAIVQFRNSLTHVFRTVELLGS